MTHWRRTALFSALALAAAVSLAAAGTENSVRIEILDTTSWNGTELSAGHYTVAWDEDGSDLKVTVKKGRRVVAEGRGQLETRDVEYKRNAVVTRRSGDGTRTLAELRFAGKKEVLVLAGS